MAPAHRPRRLAHAAALTALVLLVSSCAAGGDTYATDQAGFFSGVWHGWIAPIALVAHIFNDTIRIYEANNTGIWYDVGFYIAVISGFGSLGLRRGKRPKRAPRPKRDHD